MSPTASDSPNNGWPSLLVNDWTDTRDTLHMWTQIVGKIRLAYAPLINHWWQVPLYVSPRGLTTSAIPHGSGTFDMEFDFHDHQLHIRTGDGRTQDVALAPKPVADFYAETLAALSAVDIQPRIRPVPTEVEQAVPFERDREHASYDPAAARLFWCQLVQADRVFTRFRSHFIGKVSPVHFFWGALDLACTRFSGRTAPTHPGGAPNCGDWVMVEGYSHELSSCGFWPGGSAEGSFYSYAYPEPEGYAACPTGLAAAAYNAEFRQFLLPYDVVRSAPDPDGLLLEFLQSTYAAAADLGRWNRVELETDPHRWTKARADGTGW